MDLAEFKTSLAHRANDAAPRIRDDALRRALGLFFRESTIWRQRFTTVLLEAGEAEYDLSQLSLDPICAITDVRLMGSQYPVVPTTESYLNSTQPGWRAIKGREPSKYLAPSGPHMLRLFPIPDESGKPLDIELAFYPGRETSEIPDWIGEMYFDDIVDGATSFCYAIPNRGWSNRTTAADFEQTLLAAARRARARVEKSNTRSIVTMVTTPFDGL